VAATVQAINPKGVNGAVPIDLATASASGLDPDITPAAAYYQVARVAAERHMSEDAVRSLVAAHVTPRQFGLLGEPRVNVLELNLALDGMGK
jgi:K+-transporting ATPase ATPase C chain